MLKKIILIVFGLILFTNSDIFSQKKVYDVVVLKSGINVVGAIIEVIPGEYLKIYDTRGIEQTINFSDVARIEKQNFDLDNFLGTPLYQTEENTLSNTLNIIYSVGFLQQLDIIQSSYNMDFSVFYQVKQVSFGPGVFHSKLNKKDMVAPFFGIRYTFHYRKVKPFFFFQGGYSFLEKESKGSFFRIGSGIKYELNNRFSLNAHVSGMIKNYSYDIQDVNPQSPRIFKVAGTQGAVMFNAEIQFDVF